MISGVWSLESISRFNDSNFGNKAINLSSLLSDKWGADYVLPGFCITFNMRDDFLPQLEALKDKIEKAYHELLAKDVCKAVIVRSSANREDGEEIAFPGILKSFDNIENFSSLYKAVQYCVESALGERVEEYTSAHGVSMQFDFFTVLVQAELQTEYAGVAFTQLPLPYLYNYDIMITQLTCGDNHKLVKGIGLSNIYTLCNEHTKLTYRCLQQALQMERTIEKKLLEKLYDVILKLKELFRYQLDIEWGYAAGKLYIYQVRFLKTAVKNSIKDRYITAFEENAAQGMKYQSMFFFAHHNLFQRKIFLFPKETSIKEIREKLLKQSENTPLTIRFSNQCEIGLPRIFAATPHDAVSEISRLKRDEWSVIAYNTLQVKDSFELYLDKDKAILEHVPGIWESDSKLMADTVLLTKDDISFWLSKESRIAKYEDCSGVCMKKVPPMSLSSAYQSVTQLFPIIKKLRVLLGMDLPLNLHFISDGKRVYFLNCRLSSPVKLMVHNQGAMYKICEIMDCAGWDGKKPILFEPQICRGEEKSLIEFVPFLKQVEMPIYVNFGILSHPAIMLREFGINVMPRLIHHSYYKINNILKKVWGEKKMEQKQKNPFLTRIIYEPQHLENECFGVVPDIEPIVPEHYLFYSKIWLPSIADCDIEVAVDFLENQFTKTVKKPYAYFERGRASFCTSMKGVLHGHGHLVPVFTKELASLFPYGEIEEYPSLMDAYHAVDVEGQYLLWGNLGGNFYLIRNVECLPKRTIRNTIRSFMN